MKIKMNKILLVTILLLFSCNDKSDTDTSKLPIGYWATYALKDLKQYGKYTHVHVVDEFGNKQIHSNRQGSDLHIIRLTVENSISKWPKTHLDEKQKFTESTHELYYSVEINVNGGKGRWSKWPTIIKKTVHVTCSDPVMINSKEFNDRVLVKISKFDKDNFESILKE